MPEDDPQVVRLTIPAGGDLEPVAEVAVAVLARRLRLGDDAVTAARAAIRDAAEEVDADGGGPDVQVEITTHADRLEVALRSGSATRTLTIPGATSPPR